eukprot:1142612-Pelagomonas_calceolata.AAC.2
MAVMELNYRRALVGLHQEQFHCMVTVTTCVFHHVKDAGKIIPFGYSSRLRTLCTFFSLPVPPPPPSPHPPGTLGSALLCEAKKEWIGQALHLWCQEALGKRKATAGGAGANKMGHS